MGLCLLSSLQLALVAAQPLLNIVTVTLEPVYLGADSIKTLLNSTVVTLGILGLKE
jgi:hypothetical protein